MQQLNGLAGDGGGGDVGGIGGGGGGGITEASVGRVGGCHLIVEVAVAAFTENGVLAPSSCPPSLLRSPPFSLMFSPLLSFPPHPQSGPCAKKTIDAHVLPQFSRSAASSETVQTITHGPVPVQLCTTWWD